jgi:hypothetical protein
LLRSVTLSFGKVWKNNLITVRANPLTVLRHGKIMDFEEIGKIPERYWGYAYVKPRTEKKLKSALEARSIPCFLPLIPKARMHHATKVVSFLPMIPGYVFLSVTDEERRELKISEKHIVQIELLRESSSEKTFIEELNILKRCEILAQSEPVLINPEIAAKCDGGHVEDIRGEWLDAALAVIETPFKYAIVALLFWFKRFSVILNLNLIPHSFPHKGTLNSYFAFSFPLVPVMTTGIGEMKFESKTGMLIILPPVRRIIFIVVSSSKSLMCFLPLAVMPSITLPPESVFTSINLGFSTTDVLSPLNVTSPLISISVFISLTPLDFTPSNILLSLSVRTDA